MTSYFKNNNMLDFSSMKSISLGIFAWAFFICCFGQNPGDKSFWDKLKTIEQDTISEKEKLALVLKLKGDYENQKLNRDSVYARLLHRIGTLQGAVNGNIATDESINSIAAAIKINCSGKENSSATFCVNSYVNLANLYKSLGLYRIALQYYDSALIQRSRFIYHDIPASALMLAKTQMLYRTGDYQKAIEELSFCLLKSRQVNDSSVLPVILNLRAQSYIMQGNFQEALKDLNHTDHLSILNKNQYESINNMMLKARIFAETKNYDEAKLLYSKAISDRLKTTNYIQISDDYTNFGNFYLNSLHDYNKAKECYLLTINYARKARDAERLSKGHINLELVNLYQHNYKEAERYCIEAMKDLNVTVSSNILINPAASQFNTLGNANLVHVIIGNKTELLLKQFLFTGDQRYLTACLETALLADTLLTNIRHEQVGEQSKLYWRDFTREFFTHAMEASFLAKDVRLAFYFMEKSRSVLLNDKLNELGASARLPRAEAIKERLLQLSVISEQQKLAAIESNPKEYEVQLAKLAEAKGMVEHYIKSLENKYPAYYQYKYADEVPSLSDLQKQLARNKQSFIHYFINDTVAYVLGITISDARLLKIPKEKFNSSLLIDFLQSCSREPVSKKEFLSFRSLSFSIYQLLFQPLAIPKGRVVISPDNFLIPFDAMCTSNSGNDYLIEDYIFSYAYSARNFLKKFNTSRATGDFIGFAPESFGAHSQVADLKQSGEALKQSARHYSDSKALINSKATRKNFINAAFNYKVVNVFSHALADTTVNEPLLYMYDSIIHLSELQLVYKPATNLVVLSACQTNVGRDAKGEGVLSLARGFAAAGISSVAATLWKADEHSIYAISDKFHEYISDGMPKDSALQKAKIDFIRNSHSENPFPYFWANLILVGDEGAVAVSKNQYTWYWVAAIAFVLTLGILLFLRRRSKQISGKASDGFEPSDA